MTDFHPPRSQNPWTDFDETWLLNCNRKVCSTNFSCSRPVNQQGGTCPDRIDMASCSNNKKTGVGMLACVFMMLLMIVVPDGYDSYSGDYCKSYLHLVWVACNWPLMIKPKFVKHIQLTTKWRTLLKTWLGQQSFILVIQQRTYNFILKKTHCR